MTKTMKIEFTKLDELNLDPKNPRLGRRNIATPLTQDAVLDLMQDWTLEELAESFKINGFWPQEALIVVREKIKGKEELVVVEGNRRLAALKFLYKAVSGKVSRSVWNDLAKGLKKTDPIFTDIPYIQVKARADVSAYLGFRHVTGIKEWNPAEKAQYIAKLIEDDGLTYDEVRRKIGSKAPVVRQNYLSYRLLLQMENREEISIDSVENKFSVLYLSLRTAGAQEYLGIDIQSDEKKAKSPVPKTRLKKLDNYAKWLFGDEKTAPIFTDSRNVDDFGKILESKEGVDYLERTPNPRFELARRKAGIGEEDLAMLISTASDSIQLALTDVHLYKKSTTVQKAVKRLGSDANALFNNFPEVKKEILAEMQEDAGSA